MAKVWHQRHQPVDYSFTHPVMFLVWDIKDFARKLPLKLFSINQWNMFGINLKNYGFAPLATPKQYVIDAIASMQCATEMIEEISLITMPSLLGFVFNPVSFWCCFDAKQQLRYVLVEVNNTFGERHAYVCHNQDFSAITKDSIIQHKKVFHVSPFCEVKGHYDFNFDITDERVRIKILYYDQQKPLISTSIFGERTAISDRQLLKAFFKLPLFTVKVVLLIHYHALRLWLKRVPYITKPDKPNADIT